MEDLKQLADKYADQFGLDRDLYRGLIQQESAWNPNAVSNKGAFGLTQIMPDTAAQPGYGVKPMQDKSINEQLRFGAEYLSTLIKKNAGKVDLALASYNAGFGNVLKHKGIPPFKETQDYVAKILGNREAQAAPTQVGMTQKQIDRQVSLDRAHAITSQLPTAPTTDRRVLLDSVIQLQDEREANRQANQATFGSSMEHSVVHETVSGMMAQLADAGPVDPNWKRTRDDEMREAAMGIVEVPEIDAYVKGARNKEDYQRRLAIAGMQLEHYKGMANANGWDFARAMAGGFVGAAADPVMAAASGFVGNALNAARIGRATWRASKLGRPIINAIEGGGTNAVASLAIQSALNTEVSWTRVLEDGLFGATFGAALSAPSAARYAAREARDMAEFDAQAAALGQALDANAPADHVQAIQRKLDQAKVSLINRAAAEGDVIGAELWGAAAPGVGSADVASLAKMLRQRADAAIAEDPHFAPAARQRTWKPSDQTEPIEVRGMRLSKEASAIRDFAYNAWKEDVDPVLADMQKRMRAWYDVREQKLKNYAGLSQWLDSPGLVLNQSKSKVARMLGAHLFESATGFGKREQTAALNYEVLHSRLAHNYIPELKAALYDGLKEQGTTAYVRNLFGGARDAESKFWRDVMVERTNKRNAINAKQEYVSTATEPVRKAAGILDKFWGEAAEHLEREGIEEGTAIKRLGVAGHVPYNWNAGKIAAALRNDPEAFDALQQLLQAEFRNKVLDKAFEGLAETGQAKLKAKVSDLEGDIAAIQDSIADMEKTRQTVDTARDNVQNANAMVADLNAQKKAITATERKLKEDLKTAPDDADLPTDPVEIEPKAEAKLAAVDAVEEVVDVIESLDSRLDMGALPFTGITKGRTREQLRKDLKQQEAKATAYMQAMREFDLSPEARSIVDPVLDAFEADFGDTLDELVVFFSKDDLRAYYNASEHLIHQSGASVDKAGKVTFKTEKAVMTALHELTHARTSRWLSVLEQIAKKGNPQLLGSNGKLMEWGEPALISPEVAAKHNLPDQITEAWNALEGVRGKLRELRPDLIGQDAGIGYAMRNSHELLAMVMNDKWTRDVLNGIQVGGVSLLRRVWEIVAKALGVKTGSALEATINSLDTLSSLQGRWTTSVYSPTVPINYAPRASKGQIKQQLAALKQQKQEIEAKLKELRAQKKAVGDAAKKVNSTENAEKLKNLRLQLDNRKAQLADIQRDPLGWWAKQVGTLRNAAYAKADNLTSSYLQQIIKDPKSRVQPQTLHVTRLAEDLLKENWAGKEVDAELAEAFSDLLRERLADRSRTELDLGKTLDVGGREVALMDFMDLDGIAQVKSGSHSVAGRVALSKVGIGDEVDAEAAITAARTDGATDEEIDALRFGLDFFLNKMDASDPAALHALRNMTYFTRMGKLGMSIVADVPMIIGALGLKTGLKVWGQSFLQLNFFDSKKAYNGKPTEFAKQLAVVAPGALGRDFRLLSLVPDDPASGAGDLRAASLLQRASMRGTQLTSYVSGANAVNMAMHRALLPILSEELLAAVKGNSKINAVRLADAGLTPDWIERIKTQMSVHDKGRKQGDKVNWDQWEDQEAADVLIGAIHRAMFQTLQKSLIGERPAWMATNQLGRLIGQFRSFGLTAAEKQSARLGVGVQDAGVAVSAVMGIVWAALMYYARVNMNAAGREDAEAYVDEAMSGMKLAAGVLTMWSMSGIGADLAGVMGTIFGGTQYSGGPAAALGVLQDITRAAGAVGGAVVGEKEGAEAAKATVRLLPGANSIPITYLLNEMSEN